MWARDFPVTYCSNARQIFPSTLLNQLQKNDRLALPLPSAPFRLKLIEKRIHI